MNTRLILLTPILLDPEPQPHRIQKRLPVARSYVGEPKKIRGIFRRYNKPLQSSLEYTYLLIQTIFHHVQDYPRPCCYCLRFGVRSSSQVGFAFCLVFYLICGDIDGIGGRVRRGGKGEVQMANPSLKRFYYK